MSEAAKSCKFSFLNFNAKYINFDNIEDIQ